jgi:hypothetical protein
MTINISDFLKKALDYFDEQNLKYSNYLKKSYMIQKKNNDKIIYDKDKEININKQILGCLYHKTNVFIWGWVFSNFTLEENKLARELLNYGLNLDPNHGNINHYFLKTLLVNSRLLIDNDFDLELLLSICSYILKNKMDFLYSQDRYDDKNKVFITEYYLIKKK